MLTRSEIVYSLRKMGYHRLDDLKTYCRQYERYIVPDSLPPVEIAQELPGRRVDSIPAPQPFR